MTMTVSRFLTLDPNAHSKRTNVVVWSNPLIPATKEADAAESNTIDLFFSQKYESVGATQDKCIIPTL